MRCKLMTMAWLVGCLTGGGVVRAAESTGTAAGGPPVPVVWSIDEGVQSPESAYYDAESGHLFVSQIGAGGPLGKDGDGCISRLTVDGRIVTDRWVTGLNAPKGMRSHRGTLWVSDIDRLIGIDIAEAKIVRQVEVPGARFLNDVACGPDGTVYVADTMGNRIHRYRNGKLDVLAELEGPNGLLVENGKLIVATWGQGMQQDFSTDQPGRLLSIHLKSGEKSAITPQPIGNLDGVESDHRGGYLVTDWMAGKVLHVSGQGQVATLLTRPQGTADHAFLAAKRWLIVPEMLENKLTAFDLSDVLGARKQ